MKDLTNKPMKILKSFNGLRYIVFDFIYTIYPCIDRKTQHHRKQLCAKIPIPNIKIPMQLFIRKKTICYFIVCCYPCYYYNLLCKYFTNNNIAFCAPISGSIEKYQNLLFILCLLYDEVKIIYSWIGFAMVGRHLQNNKVTFIQIE